MSNRDFVRKIKADVFDAVIPLVSESVDKLDYDEVMIYLKDMVKNLDENYELTFSGKVYWK